MSRVSAKNCYRRLPPLAHFDRLRVVARRSQLRPEECGTDSGHESEQPGESGEQVGRSSNVLVDGHLVLLVLMGPGAGPLDELPHPSAMGSDQGRRGGREDQHLAHLTEYRWQDDLQLQSFFTWMPPAFARSCASKPARRQATAPR
jgi:hypothetical protein